MFVAYKLKNDFGSGSFDSFNYDDRLFSDNSSGEERINVIGRCCGIHRPVTCAKSYMKKLFAYLALVVLNFYFHFNLLFPTSGVGRKGSMLTAVLLGSAAIWGSPWLETWSSWREEHAVPAVVFVVFGWGVLLLSLVIGFVA